MKMVRVKNINPVFFSLPQHSYFTFVQQRLYTCASIDLQLCDKPAVTASPQMLLKHDSGCCYTGNHIFRASSSIVCDTDLIIRKCCHVIWQLQYVCSNKKMSYKKTIQTMAPLFLFQQTLYLTLNYTFYCRVGVHLQYTELNRLHF